MNPTDYNQLIAEALADPVAFRAKFGNLGAINDEEASLRQRMAQAQALAGDGRNIGAEGRGVTQTSVALGGIGNLIGKGMSLLGQHQVNKQIQELAPRKERALMGQQMLEFMKGRGKHQDDLELAQERQRNAGWSQTTGQNGEVVFVNSQDPTKSVQPTGPDGKPLFRPKPKPGKGGGSGGPRQLPTGALDELAGFDTARQLLKGVADGFKKFDMGGLSGKAGGVATEVFGLQNTKAAEFEAMLAPARQAVGVLLENGKITAGDEGKYKNMLPRFGDSLAVMEQKIKAADEFLMSLMNNRRRLYEGGGYQVPPGAPAAPAPAAATPAAGTKRSPAEIRAEIDALKAGKK